jgi:hypothetical protein
MRASVIWWRSSGTKAEVRLGNIPQGSVLRGRDWLGKVRSANEGRRGSRAKDIAVAVLRNADCLNGRRAK